MPWRTVAREPAHVSPGLAEDKARKAASRRIAAHSLCSSSSGTSCAPMPTSGASRSLATCPCTCRQTAPTCGQSATSLRWTRTASRWAGGLLRPTTLRRTASCGATPPSAGTCCATAATTGGCAASAACSSSTTTCVSTTSWASRRTTPSRSAAAPWTVRGALALGLDLFRVAYERFGALPIIAEDLGTITPAVRSLVAATGFPGMDVILFANEDVRQGYTPEPGKICYTSTHDTQTLVGWIPSGRMATTTRSTCIASSWRVAWTPRPTWSLCRCRTCSSLTTRRA